MNAKFNLNKIPIHMQQYYNAITNLIDHFCQQRLNNDYQQLARYATAALCRKNLSPLLTGNINTWACAILHALGTINFLFDKNNQPFISAIDLAAEFNLSTSTVGNKAKQVRDILKMHRFDHKWCLPSKLNDNGFIWMITFKGFIIDSRTLPREIQEVAYKKGLIPYIYADQNSKIT
jgi:hypothetical protein